MACGADETQEGLGIRYCIKSELTYARLHGIDNGLISVEYSEFNERYNERDVFARKQMRELIDSDKNTFARVFGTLTGRK